MLELKAKRMGRLRQKGRRRQKSGAQLCIMPGILLSVQMEISVRKLNVILKVHRGLCKMAKDINVSVVSLEPRPAEKTKRVSTDKRETGSKT